MVISRLIASGELAPKTIQEVLDIHKIENIIQLKEELLDLLIAYINITLDDHIISENEHFNIEILKKYFKIKEGDFYRYRYAQVENILQRQFKRIYLDNKVDSEEAIHKVALQELFNLSYDQFEQFMKNEVTRALSEGTNILNLDTAQKPKTKNKEL